MPESKIISLSFTSIDNWVKEDDTNGSIGADYRQKETPPSVGWTRNCLPTLEGIRSANLFDRSGGTNNPINLGNTTNLYHIDTLVDIHGNLTYLYNDGTLSVGRTFSIYALSSNGSYWALLTSVLTGLTSMVNRYTLFQNRTIFLYYSTDTTGVLTKTGDTLSTNAFFDIDLLTGQARMYHVTGTSVSPYDKNGITSWGNYVILWNRNTIYWNDPNVFTEFTVGGSSLAGSQKISEARGNIITIVPNSEGLLIYCQDNIIHAGYSGDASNPWIFTEVTGGSGLLTLDGNPLVTRGEGTPFQVAYTATGLMRITSREASPMPHRISDFVGRPYVEVKDVGDSVIKRAYLLPANVKRPKLRKLYLYNNYLIMLIGSPEEYEAIGFNEENGRRLFLVDLTSGAVGSIEGEYVSVTPEIEVVAFSSSNDLHKRNRLYSNSFVLTRRLKISETIIAMRNKVMDLGEHSTRKITSDSWVPKESEVFITGVNERLGYETELLSVQLVGDISKSPAYAGVDLFTKVRVFVYSEYLPSNQPTEFQYIPELDKFVGFAVGKNLQVEIRGLYFYLTEALLEVQRGGK